MKFKERTNKIISFMLAVVMVISTFTPAFTNTVNAETLTSYTDEAIFKYSTSDQVVDTTPTGTDLDNFTVSLMYGTVTENYGDTLLCKDTDTSTSYTVNIEYTGTQTYQAGELSFTIKDFGAVQRDPVAKYFDLDIGAELVGSGSGRGDWYYTSEKDNTTGETVYTFTNKNIIDGSFTSSIEFVYSDGNNKIRQFVNNSSTDIQAVLSIDGGTTVKSSNKIFFTVISTQDNYDMSSYKSDIKVNTYTIGDKTIYEKEEINGYKVVDSLFGKANVYLHINDLNFRGIQAGAYVVHMFSEPVDFVYSHNTADESYPTSYEYIYNDENQKIGVKTYLKSINGSIGNIAECKRLTGMFFEIMSTTQEHNSGDIITLTSTLYGVYLDETEEHPLAKTTLDLPLQAAILVPTDLGEILVNKADITTSQNQLMNGYNYNWHFSTADKIAIDEYEPTEVIYTESIPTKIDYSDNRVSLTSDEYYITGFEAETYLAESLDVYIQRWGESDFTFYTTYTSEDLITGTVDRLKNQQVWGVNFNDTDICNIKLHYKAAEGAYLNADHDSEVYLKTFIKVDTINEEYKAVENIITGTYINNSYNMSCIDAAQLTIKDNTISSYIESVSGGKVAADDLKNGVFKMPVNFKLGNEFSLNSTFEEFGDEYLTEYTLTLKYPELFDIDLSDPANFLPQYVIDLGAKYTVEEKIEDNNKYLILHIDHSDAPINHLNFKNSFWQCNDYSQIGYHSKARWMPKLTLTLDAYNLLKSQGLLSQIYYVEATLDIKQKDNEYSTFIWKDNPVSDTSLFYFSDIAGNTYEGVEKFVNTGSGYTKETSKTATESIYTYKLRLSGGQTKVDNIIFYDNLEEAYGENEYWKGTFVGLDTVLLDTAGIAYEIYYSSNKSQTFDLTADGWIKADEWTQDLSEVKSIAVKLIDFTLNSGGSVFVEIKMKSPVDEYKGLKAYNQYAADYKAYDIATGEQLEDIKALPSNITEVIMRNSDTIYTFEKEWNYNSENLVLGFIDSDDLTEAEQKTLRADKTFTITASGEGLESITFKATADSEGLITIPDEYKKYTSFSFDIGAHNEKYYICNYKTENKATEIPDSITLNAFSELEDISSNQTTITLTKENNWTGTAIFEDLTNPEDLIFKEVPVSDWISGTYNGLAITFDSNFKTYNSSDYLQIYYSYNDKIYRTNAYYGTSLAGKTIEIPSTDFYLYWYANASSNDYYGFKIDSIVNKEVTKTLGYSGYSLPTYTPIELTGNNYPETAHIPYDSGYSFWHYTYPEIDNVTLTQVDEHAFNVKIENIGTQGYIVSSSELSEEYNYTLEKNWNISDEKNDIVLGLVESDELTESEQISLRADKTFTITATGDGLETTTFEVTADSEGLITIPTEYIDYTNFSFILDEYNNKIYSCSYEVAFDDPEEVIIPDSVIITASDGTVITLSEENNWTSTHTFNSSDITFTETPIEGWESNSDDITITKTGDNTYNVVVRNIKKQTANIVSSEITAKKIEFNFKKEWNISDEKNDIVLGFINSDNLTEVEQKTLRADKTFTITATGDGLETVSFEATADSEGLITIPTEYNGFTDFSFIAKDSYNTYTFNYTVSYVDPVIPDSIALTPSVSGYDVDGNVINEIVLTKENNWEATYMFQDTSVTFAEELPEGWEPAGELTNGLAITFNDTFRTYRRAPLYILYEYNGLIYCSNAYINTALAGQTIEIPSTDVYFYINNSTSTPYNLYGFKVVNIEYKDVSTTLGSSGYSLPTDTPVELTGNNYPESAHNPYNTSDVFWHYTGEPTVNNISITQDGNAYNVEVSNSGNKVASVVSADIEVKENEKIAFNINKEWTVIDTNSITLGYSADSGLTEDEYKALMAGQTLTITATGDGLETVTFEATADSEGLITIPAEYKGHTDFAYEIEFNKKVYQFNYKVSKVEPIIPDSITVIPSVSGYDSDGNEISEIILTAENNWTTTVKFKNPTVTFTEKDVIGWSGEISVVQNGEAYTVSIINTGAYSYASSVSVTNKKIDFNITKNWKDDIMLGYMDTFDITFDDYQYLTALSTITVVATGNGLEAVTFDVKTDYLGRFIIPEAYHAYTDFAFSIEYNNLTYNFEYNISKTTPEKPESVTLIPSVSGYDENGNEVTEIILTAENNWFTNVKFADPDVEFIEITPADWEVAKYNGVAITFNKNSKFYNASDFVYIYYEYDGKMYRSSKYTQSLLSGKTIEVPSTDFYICMHADSSNNEAYGFSIDSIKNVDVVRPLGSSGFRLPSGEIIETSGLFYPESSHTPYSSGDMLWHYTYPVNNDANVVKNNDGTYSATLTNASVDMLTINSATSSIKKYDFNINKTWSVSEGLDDIILGYKTTSGLTEDEYKTLVAGKTLVITATGEGLIDVLFEVVADENGNILIPSEYKGHTNFSFEIESNDSTYLFDYAVSKIEPVKPESITLIPSISGYDENGNEITEIILTPENNWTTTVKFEDPTVTFKELPVEGWDEYAEPTGLAITFNENCSSYSSTYGYVYIYYYYEDSIYRLGKYSGTALAGQTIEIPSTDFYIQWQCPSTYANYYGIKVDDIKPLTKQVEATGSIVSSIPGINAFYEIHGKDYPETTHNPANATYRRHYISNAMQENINITQNGDTYAVFVKNTGVYSYDTTVKVGDKETSCTFTKEWIIPEDFIKLNIKDTLGYEGNYDKVEILNEADTVLETIVKPDEAGLLVSANKYAITETYTAKIYMTDGTTKTATINENKFELVPVEIELFDGETSLGVFELNEENNWQATVSVPANAELTIKEITTGNWTYEVNDTVITNTVNQEIEITDITVPVPGEIIDTGNEALPTYVLVIFFTGLAGLATSLLLSRKKKNR